MSKKDTGFEDSLAELEKLIEAMETGGLSLEDSLKHFEKGTSLLKTCQKTLTEAEQKVRLLSKSEKLSDFPDND